MFLLNWMELEAIQKKNCIGKVENKEKAEDKVGIQTLGTLPHHQCSQFENLKPFPDTVDLDK